MFRKILPLLVALVGLAGLTQGAAAADFFAFGRHDDDSIRVWKPYVIEKNCVDDFYHCKVRMDYAPFQRSMVARSGSYWYQKPFQVYRYGDFKPQRTHWGRHHSAAHVAWCSDRYRTYDPVSNYYTGRGYQLMKCRSPYGG